MKKSPGFPATLALSLATGMPAIANTADAQTQVELSAESSRLSNDSPDWQELSLRINQQRGQRNVKELTLTQTSRFGLDDQRISGLYASPLNERLTAMLAASISPSHRVLERHGIDGTLQYEFAPAWLIHASLANKRYDSANVNQGSLMLEHYFSSFSASAAWRPVRALGVSSSSTELRGYYYYRDTNYIGVIVSSGQEATSINAGTVVLTDVRATALLGRHRLSRQWAINYAITRTRQGSFYNRNTVRLGVQHLF